MVAVVWKMPPDTPRLMDPLISPTIYSVVPVVGGGDAYGGGAGGGAVELFAHGDGVLTITSGGKILANGGDTSTQHSQSGGAGSGGAIRLEGGSISIAGTLEAKGGNGLTATPGGGGPYCD